MCIWAYDIYTYHISRNCTKLMLLIDIGLGMLRGICSQYGVSIIHDMGLFSSAQTTAHEIGHRLVSLSGPTNSVSNRGEKGHYPFYHNIWVCNVRYEQAKHRHHHSFYYNWSKAPSKHQCNSNNLFPLVLPLTPPPSRNFTMQILIFVTWKDLTNQKLTYITPDDIYSFVSHSWIEFVIKLSSI